MSYSVRRIPIFSGWRRIAHWLILLAAAGTTCAFGWWWFSLSHIPQNFPGWVHVFDYILFALLSYVVWYQIINELLSWEVSIFMKRPEFVPPEEGLRVALLTAFVPGKEPFDVLEKTLAAMVKVEYPHDTWLLDEGDAKEAKRLCKKYGVKHYTRYAKEEFNMEEGPFKRKTKAGNYNSWFHQNGEKYEIVAQHDVDFVPAVNFLTRTLGYLRDPEVAFVGTPQIYGNISDSWIVKGAAEQAYGFYGTMQKGLDGIGMQLFVGANHIFRVSAHNDIDGYSGHIVEDHLTGMRLYARKWKSIYVPEVLAVGEGPATWEAYFSQQMRWAYGLIDILFRHSPSLFKQMHLRHSLHYFLLQQYYFFGLAQVIGVALLTMYFFFGIQSTEMNLTVLLILYPLVLVWQLAVFLWLQQTYIDPEKESGIHLAGKILNVAVWPIYFLALIGVLRSKRLVYEVTPKGSGSHTQPIQIKLFLPHIILGAVSGVGILVGFITDNISPQLIFWAVLNTLFMFAFPISAVLYNLYLKSKNLEKLSRNIMSLILHPRLTTITILVGFIFCGGAVLFASTHTEERVAVVNYMRAAGEEVRSGSASTSELAFTGAAIFSDHLASTVTRAFGTVLVYKNGI